MSEYQYYEFVALEPAAGFTSAGRGCSLSTRAMITATSLVNEYHWGGFRGDPNQLMTHYYGRGPGSDGFSIPAQREANKQHAHRLGALVVAEFIERGRSGRSSDRPELQRMLYYVSQRQIDYVIVHTVDQLARNRADDCAVTATLRDAGTQLVSSTEGIDCTPNGQLVHGIMASIAEFY